MVTNESSFEDGHVGLVAADVAIAQTSGLRELITDHSWPINSSPVIDHDVMVTAFGKPSDGNIYVLLGGKADGINETGSRFEINADDYGIQIFGERGLDTQATSRTADIWVRTGSEAYATDRNGFLKILSHTTELQLISVLHELNANLDRWDRGLESPTTGFAAVHSDYEALTGVHPGDVPELLQAETVATQSGILEILENVSKKRSHKLYPHAGDFLNRTIGRYRRTTALQSLHDRYTGLVIGEFREQIKRQGLDNLGFSMTTDYCNQAFGLSNYGADAFSTSSSRFLGDHIELDLGFIPGHDTDIVDWTGWRYKGQSMALSDVVRQAELTDKTYSFHISSQISIDEHAESGAFKFGWLVKPKGNEGLCFGEEGADFTENESFRRYSGYVDASARLRDQYGADIKIVSAHITKAGTLIDGHDRSDLRSDVCLDQYIEQAVALRQQARAQGLTFLVETGGLRDDQVFTLIDKIREAETDVPLEDPSSAILLYDPSHTIQDVYAQVSSEREADGFVPANRLLAYSLKLETVERMDKLHERLLGDYSWAVGAGHVSQMTGTETGYIDIHRPLGAEEGDSVQKCLDRCSRELVRFGAIADRHRQFYIDVESAPSYKNMKWVYNALQIRP